MPERTQEEQDLETAIALSLQDASTPSAGPSGSKPSNGTKRKRQVIDLASSSDDEEAPVQSEPIVSKTSSAMSSRAQMERERLERVKARELAGEVRPSKVQARDTSKSSQIATFSSLQQEPEASTSQQSTSDGPKYFEPQMMHVYNKYRSGDVHAIKFEEIIGNVCKLRNAVLCTMCADPLWLISQFGPTPVTLIAKGGPDDATGVYPGQPWPSCTLVIPKMMPTGENGYKTFHPKFMILQYDTWVRIVISTANLMDFDYDTLDNIVWIVDIHQNSATPERTAKSPFFQTFSKFLKGIGLPSSHWEDLLSKLDYGCIDARWRVVASLTGSRPDTPERPWGYVALGRALTELGLRPEKSEKLHLECQGSSIGWYTKAYLKAFHEGLPGVSPQDVYPLIRVLYPTAKYVTESPGGVNEGGTIFCSAKTWKNSDFKQVAAQSRSRRDGLLMHAKSIIGYLDGDSKDGKKARGFLYVGSHNFTPAAWGKKKEKNGTFICPNTELGVVRIIEADSQESLQKTLNEISPVQRPVERYGPNDVPWIQPSR